ncbi:unnamed protein product [Protopolystoma xenopodis]|uniref:Uncharacterized protein n=1 Tax=Protopolystoma xenopodis TaxID=117903 RepID=A0A3S5CS48_9PLAT|nr:unnamed protein product [Protopolystoma xenopodis]
MLIPCTPENLTVKSVESQEIILTVNAFDNAIGYIAVLESVDGKLITFHFPVKDLAQLMTLDLDSCNFYNVTVHAVLEAGITSGISTWASTG